MKPAGTQLPEQPPSYWHCGTFGKGYLYGSHPTEVGKSVTRTVCFSWSGNKCKMSNVITVINCDGYFVYQLPNTPHCQLGYCAE